MPFKDPQKKIDYDKKYAKEHPNLMRKHKKIYADKNKDKKHKYYVKNKESIKKYHKEYRKKNPDTVKKTWLKFKYGLTLEQYNEMELRQNGLCAICLTETKLVVDHDHSTGKVRELLCADCNRGLGCYKDEPIRLQRSIEYLIKHSK